VRQDSASGRLTYAYDNADRVTSVQETGQAPFRADFSYTNRDQLSSITRYSDLAGTATVLYSAYTYDNAGRLTNLHYQKTSGGTNVANYTYAYDAASRVTSEQANGTLRTFSYDTKNEVTNDGTVTYSYDATGNRTMSGYQTGTGNRLTNDSTYTYTYDAEGNLIEKSAGSAGDTWLYSYDNANRLVSVEHLPTNSVVAMVATYSYDAFGNRVEKDVSSGGVTTVTRFAYDGSDVWATLNGSNQLQTRYVREPDTDQLLARITSGGTLSGYVTDWQGSVRNLVDSSGTVQDTIVYDGFGNVTSESNTGYSDQWKYTGGFYDAETGYYTMWGRVYNPQTGRWLEQDPLGFAGGDTNLYGYVGNDATNLTDPSGLFSGIGGGGGSGGGTGSTITDNVVTGGAILYSAFGVGTTTSGSWTYDLSALSGFSDPGFAHPASQWDADPGFAHPASAWDPDPGFDDHWVGPPTGDEAFFPTPKRPLSPTGGQSPVTWTPPPPPAGAAGHGFGPPKLGGIAPPPPPPPPGLRLPRSLGLADDETVWDVLGDQYNNNPYFHFAVDQAENWALNHPIFRPGVRWWQAYNITRATGESPLNAGKLATMLVIADTVGVTELDEAVEGTDALTAQQLGTGERWMRGINGSVKLVSTGVAIYGAAGAAGGSLGRLGAAAEEEEAAVEGIYEFPDQTNGGRPYVGQSGNVPNRLGQHEAAGRLQPGTEITTRVTGGKTAREIAEHNRIQELTGGQRARNSAKVANQNDPIGPNRRPGLGLPEPRD
jgi:RHS repeat-associated protein